jgi:hypothetical protein
MTEHPMLDDRLPGVATLAAIVAATGATSVADSLAAATDVQVSHGPHRRRAGHGWRPDDVSVDLVRATWHGPSGHLHRVVVLQVVRVSRGDDATVLVGHYAYSGEVGEAETDALVLLALAGLLAPWAVAFEL